MLAFLNNELIFSKMTEIVPVESSEDGEIKEDHLIFQSDQYYTDFDIPKPTNVITASDQNTTQVGR
jgi:hypothetical protein